MERIIDLIQRKVRSYLNMPCLVGISFYLLVALIILLTLLMIFSIIYIDSTNPLCLFSLPQADFSYKGSPVFLSLTENSNNSVTCELLEKVSVDVSGSSYILLNPCYFNSTVLFKDVNGSSYTLSGPVKLISAPGSRVSINTYVSPDSMGRSYFKLDFVNASIDMLRQNNNSYLISFYGFPGAQKSYNTDFGVPDPRLGSNANYYHQIKVTDGIVGVGDPSNVFNGTVTIRGDVYAVTGNVMTALFLTKTVNNLNVREADLSWADGSLLISKKQYACTGADNITIDTPQISNYPIFFEMGNGHCRLTGTARSIMLNFQEYLQQPIKMLLRDNYITFLFAMLIGIITLSLKRLTHLIKSK